MSEVIVSGLEQDSFEEQCQHFRYMSRELFAQEYKHPEGLRGLETEFGTYKFLYILAEMMKNPELEIYTDIMFSILSNSAEMIPTNLYLCGFGQHLDQPLDKNPRGLLKFCQHLTEEDKPFFDTDSGIFLPCLKKDPELTSLVPCLTHWIGGPAKRFENPDYHSEGHIYITHMSTSYALNMQARYFEAWAYGLAALDRKASFPLYTLRSGVYNQLAISSANLSLSPHITWLCLAESVRVQNHPLQKWEWICASVQVLNAFGLFDLEEKLYRKGLEIIPEKSSWYQVLIRHHLRGLHHQVDNCLMVCVFMVNWEVPFHPNEDYLMRARRAVDKLWYECEKLESLGLKKYYKGYSFLYRCLFAQNLEMKQRMFKLALNTLTGAVHSLPDDELVKIEASVMVQHMNKQHVSDSDHHARWFQWTKTGESNTAADGFLRMGLLFYFAVPILENTDNTNYFARALHNYKIANQSRGYRGHLLKNVDMFQEKKPISRQEKTIAMNFIRYASDYWKEHKDIQVGPREPTAEELLHKNVYAERAYLEGELISNPYIDDDFE